MATLVATKCNPVIRIFYRRRRAAGKAPKPGSYAGRRASEPKDKIQTLTDPSLYDGSLAKPIVLPNKPQPEPAA